MKRICMYLIAAALPFQLAFAKCAVFNLEDELAVIPHLLRVQISESVPPKNCGSRDSACFYSFKAKVLEVLKGQTKQRSLTISYPYRSIRPAMILFEDGDEVILALKDIEEDGQASLYGTKCGRWGTSIGRLEKLRELLPRIK